MPHCAVDSTGSTLLYYEDTGAPSGSLNYVTIFLVHGTMFSSGMLPVLEQLATGLISLSSDIQANGSLCRP